MQHILCAAFWSAIMVAQASAATEHIYELIIEGKRTGYCRYTTRSTEAGLETTGETVIKVSLLGAPFDMTYRSVALHSADGKQLLSYRLEFTRGAEIASCVVTPSGGQLTVATTSGDKTTTTTHPMGPNTFLVEGNMLDTWAQMIGAMGSTVTSVTLISPLAGASQKLRVSRPGRITVAALGRKRACDRIRFGEGASAIEMLVARDTREIVEMRVPAQNAAFRKATAAALQGLATYDPGARLFSIVNDPLPEPDKLTLLKCRARIQVAGEKPSATSLRLPYQKFTGTARNGLVDGIFEVTPYAYDGKNAPAMASLPPSDPKLAVYLKPEPNVECDDPEIKALAKELTTGCDTAWQAVVKIGAWVRANITYAITGSGARECLRARKGDCGPHAWLTIALCRAAGIPARITGGVLYSRALGGSFGQHYWTRVWMGSDGWIPIDTTTGEVGTLSPAHITLWDLAGLASLDVKVLAYAPKPEATEQVPQTPRRTYRPKVGETERWVFQSDGQEIATQTAECTGVGDQDGRSYSDWRFEFSAPSSSTSMKGTLSLWLDAAPRTLSVEASAGGGAQSASYRFTPAEVSVDLKIGEMPVQRQHRLQPGQMLQMNNNITAFSLAMRSLALKPGETRTVPFFAASSLQSLDITFAVAREPRSIEALGKSVSCLVCEVEPIKNRFYLDADTGEILRVETFDGKLVIERR